MHLKRYRKTSADQSVVGDYDKQRNSQIEQSHERYKDFRDPGYLSASSEDADCEDHSEHQADNQRCGRFTEKLYARKESAMLNEATRLKPPM